MVDLSNNEVKLQTTQKALFSSTSAPIWLRSSQEFSSNNETRSPTHPLFKQSLSEGQPIRIKLKAWAGSQNGFYSHNKWTEWAVKVNKDYSELWTMQSYWRSIRGPLQMENMLSFISFKCSMTGPNTKCKQVSMWMSFCDELVENISIVVQSGIQEVSFTKIVDLSSMRIYLGARSFFLLL